MPAGYRSGQILVLVLLIVVVALAVGLSVASRNITNLRTATQTEQSQRAFSAAEGGVEDTLSKLQSVAPTTTTSPTNRTVEVGDLSANVTVTAKAVYERLESPLTQGEVGQIFLPGTTGNVQVDWVKTSTEASTPASLYISVVSGTNPSNYVMTRRLFAGGWAGGTTSDETGAEASNVSCTPSTGYSKCALIAMPSSPQYMRIRTFWSDTSVKVSGATLPIQTYEITSTATTDNGVSRELKVVRNAYPVLPAAFDYALYSEGGINK